MCEERIKTQCVHCELVQWAEGRNCRRCGEALPLPVPVVNLVEHLVERGVLRNEPNRHHHLEEACTIISAAVAGLQNPSAIEELSVGPEPISAVQPFPTLDAVERAMIVAAYRKANRKSAVAAR